MASSRGGSCRYVVGIDLGTTHCAVAYSPAGRADVHLFEVPQLIGPGEVAERRLLPSFLYLPAEGELSEDARALPWGRADVVVGEYARRHGAEVPNRLVGSAKSWICHGGVNRKAPILPWSAPDTDAKVSPYLAQVRYLEHLRQAWDRAHPDARLTEQDVVVTVPASFDEVARELTVQAAKEAGLRDVKLLEEPQAAFYDSLGAHKGELRERFWGARLVLVVDVGGGTTDLTLLKVAAEPDEAGEPVLERIAVGGHLMLGGDNMDAALAHHVAATAELSGQLDPTEWAKLTAQVRQAKERLLQEGAPDEVTIAIQRRGKKLIGGTKSVALGRDEARALLVDGFLPFTTPGEVAEAKGRAGLTTLGLPYTSDPAIPRHIAAFLRRHERAATAAGARVQSGLCVPDLVLLNGGVFHAPALRQRLFEVMEGWFGQRPGELSHTSLDVAVASGAARYALARRGLGRVIAGGAARAYYVGVEGKGGERRALCVAEKGMEEGARTEVSGRTFQLVVNQPVRFDLFAYAGDREDEVGAIVPIEDDGEDPLDALPTLETVVKQKGDLWVDPKTGGVPVRLETSLSEAGTLELSLVTVELPPRRFRLELDLGAKAGAQDTARADGAPPAAGATTALDLPEAPLDPLPKAFGEARRALERPFGNGRYAHSPEATKGLRQELEGALGPRGEWPLSVCRGLFDELIGAVDRRGRTPQHELNWLRLLSFCARPGFGAAGDKERIEQLWGLYDLGLKHTEDKGVWAEWWILWRRVAPALSKERQRALFDAVKPWLSGEKPPKGKPRAFGLPEMLRMLAALERLSPRDKQEAKGWLDVHFKKVGSYWPLGRLGARVPFHADPSSVVPPEVAEAWLEELLPLDWKTADGASFAALLLARATGDPLRDLSDPRRKQVIDRLRAVDAPTPWIEMLTKATAMGEGDARRTFGESLPAGLRLA